MDKEDNMCPSIGFYTDNRYRELCSKIIYWREKIFL